MTSSGSPVRSTTSARLRYGPRASSVVEPLGMLLADPLDQAEPEPDPPADRALGRPASPGLGRRDDAGRRADGLGPPVDARVRRERLRVDPDPLGRRQVGARVDVDRQDGDAVALRVVDQDLDRVEAHRLGVDQPGQELGRVEQLEERRLVGGPGEGRGMTLGEAEAGERGDLAEELLGGRLVHARLAEAAVDEPAMELLHLAGRAPRPHRPPEAVRLGRLRSRRPRSPPA